MDFEQLPSGKCTTCDKQIIQVDGNWEHADIVYHAACSHEARPANTYDDHLEIRTDTPNRNEQVW